MLRYLIAPDAEHHLYRVELTLPAPADNLLHLRMPVWTPGSYVLREYSGRVRGLRAFFGNRELPVRQTEKALWVADAAGVPAGESVRVVWEAFAHSTGIHDAWIDCDRGFINPCAVMIHPDGADREPAQIRFDAPDWNVQCALDEADGVWCARNLDELLDSTYTLTRRDGRLAHVWTVEACGVPHQIVITGVPSLNRERLTDDLRKIFETVIAFWDPEGRSAPFDRYLLQMHVAPGLYGGLEHAAGTMLLEDPETLPAEGESEAPAKYADFLCLAAHEYFHAWLVKRLKPAVFLPGYDLTKESYTRDLWIFEGFTSLYESVLPRRAGLLSDEDFRKHFARRLNAALGREGFDAMSLADSSLTAWVKLYRQTADSLYSQVSYYTKGSLAALVIDDALRTATSDVWSLERFLAVWFGSVRDDIARGVWPGLRDGELAAVILELTGVDLGELIHALTKETGNRGFWMTRIEAALARRGLKLAVDGDADPVWALSGMKLAAGLSLGYVPGGSPAFLAGLYAGDEIVAIDGERTTAGRFRRQVERARGRIVTVTVFRGERLHSVGLDLSKPPREEFTALLPLRVEAAEAVEN